MKEALKTSPLFAGIGPGETEALLSCAGASVREYGRDEIIFHQGQPPSKVYVLLFGAVIICRDGADGRRSIAARIEGRGQIFAEAYVFLEKAVYENYAAAAEDCRVLEIPKGFFFHTCANNCESHSKMIRNMLSILAGKAYYLTGRLRILSGGSLRQTLARALLESAGPGGGTALSMSREDLADFLGVARPSVSRELMAMARDGLIGIRGRQIRISDPGALGKIVDQP
ncbi:MAG: Crp/Fnr family transcriptional regulator [Clostridiaceae bacterium]|nr:Crp/Fnr family transcriptional regulator [Clostridiaceae bacterium]